MLMEGFRQSMLQEIRSLMLAVRRADQHTMTPTILTLLESAHLHAVRGSPRAAYFYSAHARHVMNNAAKMRSALEKYRFDLNAIAFEPRKDNLVILDIHADPPSEVGEFEGVVLPIFQVSAERGFEGIYVQA